jgi:hypothetical protein
MRSMHYPKQKSPGETIVKIMLCTLLIAVTIVSLSGPALDKLDNWMDNIHHQLWTVVVLTAIVFISWIYWRVKKG